MQALLNLFKEFALKKGIADDIYIVGGAVRDILSGIETKDIDLAVSGDAPEIAKEFAQGSNCSFVLLDSKFGIARVVKDETFIDLSSMRDGSIAADLAGRDITINAMALPLREWPSTLHVIDPFGGMEDLRSGTIRMVSEGNLISDPLRLLRICRFSAILHFSIEENTRDALRKHHSLLKEVAVERIAEELRHIMAIADSHQIMSDMEEDNIILALFPEFLASAGIGLKHGIKCLKQCEIILRNPSHYLRIPEKRILAYFDLPVRRICLKLAALFAGTAHAGEAALRMKMSGKEAALITSISSGYESIRSFCSTDSVESELLRFLKNVQDDVYPMVILAASAGQSRQVTSADEIHLSEDRLLSFGNKVLSLYLDEVIPRMNLLRMITGDDLIKEFSLAPSPQFKSILSALEDDILQRKVNTRDEAMAKVREILEKSSKQ